MKELSMRLFAIRDKQYRLVKGEDNKPLYFSSKQSARQHRATITQRTDEYFITYGIDHKLYKGQ
jgi:hypothetical protein